MAQSNDLKPNPKEWVQLQHDEVERHRNLKCPNYEKCLFVAGEQRWKGFTCQFCAFRRARFRMEKFRHSWGRKEARKHGANRG